MLEIILLTTIAFIITFFSIPVIILIANKKKLYDIPNERKIHTSGISSLGGVGIFLGAFFSVILASFINESYVLLPFLAALFILFFTGLKDDVIALSARKKFIVQLIAAAIIIHLGGLRIESFYGFLGINEIPFYLSYPLTYLTIVLIINAYNLIDGVDGLSGSLGILGCFIFGVYFYFSGEITFAITSFCFAASILGFLIYNFNPAKIFMGDSGSLILGLLMATFSLKLLSGPSQILNIPITANIALVVAILIVPLTDTIRVFAIRIYRRRSPFTPDRNHIHHLLLDCGFSHSGVALVCVAGNLFIIGLAVALNEYGNNIALGVISLATICSIAILYSNENKRKLLLKENSNKVSINISTNTKIISMEDITKEAIKN